MKVYTVHYETAYANGILVIAASNERAALDIAKARKTRYSLDGTTTYIPEDCDFAVEAIKDVYSKEEGVKSEICL